MSSAETRHCLNCGAELSGDFCARCGQSATVKRITFKETFQHFMSAAFSFEGPLLNTLKLLFTNPGKVYREFIEGKRKRYFKPVSFYILLSAVYLILRASIDYDPLEGQFKEMERPGGVPELMLKMRDAARFMVEHINHIMFFLAVAIGLVLKLFFYRRYNLAEYVTVGFYMAGLYVLLGIPFMLLAKYTAFQAQQLQLLVLLVIILYGTLSLFQKRTAGTVIKGILASVIGLFLYVILSFGFSLIMVLMR